MIVKQEATRDLTLSHFIRHGIVMDVELIDEKHFRVSLFGIGIMFKQRFVVWKREKNNYKTEIYF